MQNASLVALLTVAALAFGLAGCGSSGTHAQSPSAVASTMAHNSPSGGSRAAEERWFDQATYGESP